ncbi:MAG TPA: imidazole glycerol phosphate synthase subunit HisH [Candidatus Nanopelagicaceae bacterium]|nr:imidazole glycerol phosphate synthase subunit HisH [Candidatus Nanopelagicaceae bacterium]
MLVAVLDYGSGNLRSAERALERAGAQVVITSDYETCVEADGLVVPGVGAFAACMQGLTAVRAAQIIDRRLAGARPVLGICVGMQVLFDSGREHGVSTAGLGQWPGEVTQLKADVLPHMGWNTVRAASGSKLFAGIESERFYFVHSYAAKEWRLKANDTLSPAGITWANYGEDFIAAVENGSLCATQFHPEKSGDVGAHLISNWIETL